MVLWMREFNKSGKGRLQFTGFDMQTPNAAAGIVNDFVAGADPDYVDAVRQAIDMAQNAYPAASDKATGTQSLRMTPVVQKNDPKAVAKIASSTWTDAVRHLETSREAYQKKGAASRDIEWAIQNARVVLQYMQMRANEAMRDKSMADCYRQEQAGLFLLEKTGIRGFPAHLGTRDLNRRFLYYQRPPWGHFPVSRLYIHLNWWLTSNSDPPQNLVRSHAFPHKALFKFEFP